MKRRLMNGVAGTLALSVALAAGGAANATTRASSAQRHSPTGPRPSAYRTASTSSEPIEASAARASETRTTAVAGSRMITRSGATFTANGTGQPPVLAQNSAKLLLTGCVVRTTAPSTGGAPAASAAVSAKSPSLVALNGCAITTDGPGASGVVSAGQGSFVRAANSTIKTSATGSAANVAHGAMAVGGGHITLDNVNVRTTGPRATALCAVSEGTVIAHGGSMVTDGSPVIRSAGLIQVFGAKATASGADAAVIEGHGTLDAVDAELIGSAGGIVFTDGSSGTSIAPGVTAKTIAGDTATGGPATLALANGACHATALATCNLTGGSLIALAGAAFDVQRATAKVAVRNATVTGGASLPHGGRDLVRVAAHGRLAFTASGGALSGDVISHGAMSLALRNGAALTGAINGAALDLDSSSTWSVTGPSTLTALTGATVSDGTIPAITGNGHDVYYDPDSAANDWLGGEAYPLVGGGTLRPHPTT